MRTPDGGVQLAKRSSCPLTEGQPNAPHGLDTPLRLGQRPLADAWPTGLCGGRMAPDAGCAGVDGLSIALPRWGHDSGPGLEFGLVGNVSYVSRVRIERLGGPQRLAFLPAEESPVVFGVHSEVAEHYGVRPEQYPPHATTLDYVVAAAGG